MDTNKILSANILDLIFDNRNKEYGAYELRNNYPERMKKALMITAGILSMMIASLLLLKSEEISKPGYIIDGYKIVDIKPPEIKPEIPKPEKRLPPPSVKAIASTPPVIVDKTFLDKSHPTVDETANAETGTENTDGADENGFVGEETNGTSKEIVEPIDKEPEGPVRFGLQKEAKFTGNWENFLRRNLNANVPADNGAPAGNHTIIIQFVVDKDGNVSDIKPITNLGYGMEQEAIRVLKKATKWEPAIQNGHPVKAYRRQPITFQVLADE